MKIAACLALALFLQQSDGCDQAAPTPARAPEIHPNPVRRFDAVNTHGSSDVALDTMTGQLCRTWEWVYRGENNPAKGGLDELPTCFKLYTDYPFTVVPPSGSTPIR